MTAMRVKALIVAVLMAASFAGAAALRPTQRLADTRPKVKLDALFPTSFGQWVVDDRQPVQLVSPDQAAMLSKLYNDTLSRTYVNRQTGQRIMLSVAYGGDQSDGTRAHLPELCYPAQGFQIIDKHSSTLATGTHSIPVQRLFAKLGGRMEPITYWVVVGEKVALTGPQQKLAQLNYSLRGLIPDGTLVRVSNIDPDADKSYLVHDEFVRELAAAVPEALKSRVVGSPGG
jgi:EpsI family protein